MSQDQLDVLKARSLSLKAQIAVLEARLSRMIFRAPFAGTLGIYTQRLGDLDALWRGANYPDRPQPCSLD